jgi:RNA polymerase sigma-70 factor, ECF subfamily
MDEPLAVDDLVARAKTGDHDAFTALYDEFAGRVHRFLLARVAEPADAEDLLQRVFLKVIESLPGFQDRGLPFGAWLFRIARNTAIDFERTRRHTAPLDEALDHHDQAPGPARAAEHAVERTQILAGLATLTDEQRDVVLYRFFAGLSPAEIGRLMGKREGSIRALQFRALEALRRLGPDAFGDLAEQPR